MVGDDGGKDDYDRAWERRTRRERMRSGTRKASSWSGAMLLGLGPIVTALGAEALAVYNACFADPLCYPTVSAGDGWEGSFAIGLVVTLVGMMVVLSRARTSMTRDG